MRKYLSVLLLIFLSAATFAMSTLKANREISLEEKIGQMIMVGFRGTDIDDSTLSKLKNQIVSGEVGGLLFLSRNISSKKQITTLIDDLNALDAPQPLFFAVDQEGGSVARLKPKHGFKVFPSAYYVAKYKTSEEAFNIYFELASMIKEAGFNLNLAPVVDLDLNPKSPAIGKLIRSFSKDPNTVTTYAQIFIKAHQKIGILTTLKHFPGHGSAAGDTHFGAVDITKTWQANELEPYKKLIKANAVDTIMSSHIFNAKIDPKRPASLSKKHIQKKLRNELGYQGVVITDDLQMGAISKHYDLENTVILAINAGNDILLFANYFKLDKNLPNKIIKIVKKAVADGQIPKSRIDEAFARIQKIKRRFIDSQD